jgi:hypothetical protein
VCVWAGIFPALWGERKAAVPRTNDLMIGRRHDFQGSSGRKVPVQGASDAPKTTPPLLQQRATRGGPYHAAVTGMPTPPGTTAPGAGGRGLAH